MKSKMNPAGSPRHNPGQTSSAFAFAELLVVIGTVSLLALIFLPGLCRGDHSGAAFQCLNNHRQVAAAWRQWSADNTDYLLTCEASALFDSRLRPNWMVGNLNYDGSNSSTYNPAQDILKSPIWPYLGSADLFRCPADTSTVALTSPWNGYSTGTRVPRVRSYSMSQVFGRGLWLSGSNIPVPTWRTYAKGSEIVIPAKTFLFLDEHPGSLNDSAFASMCASNQPTDAPASAMMIDMPANWHNGGSAISFADDHVEIHKWRSLYLKNLFNGDNSYPPLNVNIGSIDSLGYLDARWLAERTTVAK